MYTKIIEATGTMNWGKFLIGVPDVEWEHISIHDRDGSRVRLLGICGWSREHVWVLDLQTGEGAYFRPGGHAKADLDKHRIWTCPLFEPFLEWFYDNAHLPLADLPSHVHLPHAPAAFHGYRREPAANEPDPRKHPGTTLRELLGPLGYTQQTLADALGRSIQVINMIINGKKSITAATALQLGKVTDVPAEWWVTAQALHDLHNARSKDNPVDIGVDIGVDKKATDKETA